MNLDEYRALDGVALSELVARNEISPTTLVELATQASEAYNPELNAIIGFTGNAVDEAIERLPRKPSSPLAGVPFLLKDIGVSYAGIPCEFGSRLAKGFIPETDNALARRIKDAGLITLGRTNTPELGLNVTTEPVHGGATKNPWSKAHSAGGSSGGAAAAVAAGIVPLAHANDGGGSIRIPAHCCGVVGLKPSRSRISAAPDMDEFFFGMGTQLVVSRTVRDSAAALDAFAGREPGDRFIAPRDEISALAVIETSPPATARRGVGPFT